MDLKPRGANVVDDSHQSSLWLSYNYIMYSTPSSSSPPGAIRHLISMHFTDHQSTRYQGFRLVIVALPEEGATWLPVLVPDSHVDNIKSERTITITLILSPGQNNLTQHVLQPISLDDHPQFTRLITLYDKHHCLINGQLSQLIAFGTDGMPGDVWHNISHKYTISVREAHQPVKPFPVLPQGVARTIVAYVADPTSLGSWARTVIQSVLISKNWLEAYNLIWVNGFHDGFWSNPKYPVSWLNGVIRLMLKDPPCCASLAKIPSHDHFSIKFEDAHLFFQAWETACSVAINLRELKLLLAVFTQVSGSLRTMHQVERFGVTGEALFSFLEPKVDNLGIIDVLSTICGWTKLKELDITECSNSKSPSSPPETKVDAPYSLTKLILRRGEFYGPQLLQLVSNSTHTLKYAHLTRLKYLKTSDFYQFFQQVSGTIETLRVYRCPFEDDVSSQRHNGLALDLTISDMKHLREVVIQPELASNISIAKAPLPDPGRKCVLWLVGLKGHEIAQATDPAGLGIAEALRRAHWSGIVVVVDDSSYFGGSWKAFKKTFREARRVARERSIDFRAHDLELYPILSDDEDSDWYYESDTSNE